VHFEKKGAQGEEGALEKRAHLPSEEEGQFKEKGHTSKGKGALDLGEGVHKKGAFFPRTCWHGFQGDWTA